MSLKPYIRGHHRLSYLNWLNVLVPNPLIVNTFWRYQPLQCLCPRYPQPRVRVAMSSLTMESTISKRQNQAPFSNRAVHAGYNIKAVPPRDLVFIIRRIWPINNRIYSIPPKDGNLFKEATHIVCLLCVLFWETEWCDFNENGTETSFWIN